MKTIKLISIIALLFYTTAFSEEILKLGWISPLSGGAEKYGAHLAAELAVNQINEDGGIRGKKLELIMEDGRCDPKTALSAAKKLLYLDRVKIILGGHCSSESATIAPFIEREDALMLASISATPILSQFTKNVFRTSPNQKFYANTLLNDIKKKPIKKFAILYEETEYAVYPAEDLYGLLKEQKLEVKKYSFQGSDTSLLTLITKIKFFKPDAIYIATQAQDKGAELFGYLKRINLKTQIYANEAAAYSFRINSDLSDYYENLIFAEPDYNPDRPETAKFIQDFESYHKQKVPYDFYTADAYDGLMLIAKVIQECGEELPAIRKCLKETKNYSGISGIISFDNKGDAIREYCLKTIKNGRIVKF